jgi:hypothetical protein
MEVSNSVVFEIKVSFFEVAFDFFSSRSLFLLSICSVSSDSEDNECHYHPRQTKRGIETNLENSFNFREDKDSDRD